MSRYAIITHMRREDGHPGGVPKHAWYLRRALTEAGHEVEHFAWADFPQRDELARAPETLQALALSAWIGREAGRWRWIIADGFWGCGLPDDAPVVIIAHGLWAGYEAAVGGVPAEHIEVQAATYRRFPVVAVSESARADLYLHHQVVAMATIPNAVDLDLLRPDGHGRGCVVRHTCRGRAKGGDIVEAVTRSLDGAVSVEYLNAVLGCEGPRWAGADAALHPSRYEGDAYACLEALACGVPLVHSFAGRWAYEADGREGIGVDVGAPVGEWAEAVKALLGDPNAPGRAREYAEDRADYRDFARRWVEAVLVI